MKAGELVVIVDSVEDAVKFYTERLAFDIEDLKIDKENSSRLGYARLHKGKCFIIFRVPTVQEFAEFTFIKRCTNRCVALQVSMKKGLDKYFSKCASKDITVIHDPYESSPGIRSFTIADPFGVKLTFSEPTTAVQPIDLNILGLSLDRSDLSNRQEAEKKYLEQIAATLKKFGILRRASKKFAKSKIKELVNAIKKQ